MVRLVIAAACLLHLAGAHAQADPSRAYTAAAADALTTAVDVFATVADVFGISDAVRQQTHGRSLVPLLRGEATSVRDAVLTGVWGREVHYVDRHHKYARAPVGDNAPISMWSNRWTTMPTHILSKDLALPFPDERAVLDHMPGTTVPGTVTWISPVASFTPRKIYTQDDRTQQVYEARVRLAPGAARTMRAGAEGNVRIARPAPAPPAPGGRS